jgi:hypothetical protein
LALFWKDLVLAGILIYAPLQSSWVRSIRDKMGRISGFDSYQRTYNQCSHPPFNLARSAASTLNLAERSGHLVPPFIWGQAPKTPASLRSKYSSTDQASSPPRTASTAVAPGGPAERHLEPLCKAQGLPRQRYEIDRSVTS